MASGFWATVARLLGLGQPGQTGQTGQKAPGRITTRTRGPQATPPQPATAKPAPPKPRQVERPPTDNGNADYAGDFEGKAKLAYAPVNDGNPDPGEVVWAWVPFEEDHSQGKDRPVLVIAEHRGKVLGLMLTSKDHDRDAAQEARYGRVWMDIGTGAWDRQNRPSEVRLDRVLQLDPKVVRREGAALGQSLYEEIAAAVRETKGW
ncbi:hypothetical protein GCM10022223_46000 [Kineosporia mesophila]|uniref:PemK-like, MazF-like toxin of type II toxin-antitoxin system n=1 Tax=Kineosporia mesophila TaxID=566012 RepID=A0ABP7A2R7_9ACTN|nr:type II toxin-antitoxin system PemK/MazF family toxin [Kineosporia mesophila]MCD5349014.1 type II toxin-antitoxin system PemK/MazF family toxin [Kineosporia mesophila]